MKKKVIDLYKYYEGTTHNFGFVLPPASDVTYPTIEGNTSNFLTDYNAAYQKFDRYFMNNFGSRTYYSIFDPETDAETLAAWSDDIKAILSVYLDSWARLYYALSLQYNPLYNVDGTTETTYSQKTLTDNMGARSESDIVAARDKSDIMGAKDRSDIMGARSETDTIGAKETTNGARSDTSTDYSVSYDSGTEKETGKSVDGIGQQIINEGTQSNGHTATTYTDRHTENTYTDRHTEEAHTDTHSALAYIDTHTEGQHTETVTRYGNIGVTKSSELLESEFEIRKRNFFHEIFVIISHELGLYYE